MSHDRARMLAALDSLPWQLMRELADEAEDAGEPWLAAGWRWLVDYQRWPARSTTAGWHWTRRPNDWMCWSDSLPEAVFPLLFRSIESGSSLSSCLRLAAGAVGDWLKQEDAIAQQLKARASCPLCQGTGVVEYRNGIREPCPQHAARVDDFAKITGNTTTIEAGHIFTLGKDLTITAQPVTLTNPRVMIRNLEIAEPYPDARAEDFEPLQIVDGTTEFRWLRGPNPLFGSSALPDDVFDALDCPPEGKRYRSYVTKQAAMDALSGALIRARSRALLLRRTQERSTV